MWKLAQPTCARATCARRDTSAAAPVIRASRGRRAYRNELVKRLVVHLHRGPCRLLGGGSCRPAPCATRAHAARRNSTASALHKHASARRQPLRREHCRRSRHGARRATDTRVSGVQARCTTRRGRGTCRGCRATHVARRNSPQAHSEPHCCLTGVKLLGTGLLARLPRCARLNELTPTGPLCAGLGGGHRVSVPRHRAGRRAAALRDATRVRLPQLYQRMRHGNCT